MTTSRPPSQTAVLVSLMRAAHLHLDEAPPVFSDTLALGLSGLGTVENLRATVDGLMARFERELGTSMANRLVTGMRSFLVWRARHAEDRLLAGHRRGVDQCVLLGAGLDSTAYRHGTALPGHRFFEVDHAASQAWKRERLAALGVSLPANLSFVSVDFARDDLIDALLAGGLDLGRPAVVIWMGVSMYLDRAALDGVLSACGRLAPGSELVFDYVTAPAGWSEESRAWMTSLRALTAESSEPMVGFMDTAELTAAAAAEGLTLVSDEGGREGNARHMADRRDGLHLEDEAPIRLMTLAVAERRP